MKQLQKGSSNIVLVLSLVVLFGLIAYIAIVKKPAILDKVLEKETALEVIPFQPPNFIPSKDWSIKYVALLKQAIKEKYGVDDNTLNENLYTVSVVKGTEADGSAIPHLREDNPIVRIRFIYKIDWVYFNRSGGGSFSIKDSSGNDLSDQQLLENIKSGLEPIFTIKNIISEKEATAKCPDSRNPLFPRPTGPWYNDNTNVMFNPQTSDLIFECNKEISVKENKCLFQSFSLITGAKLSSSEGACFVF